MILSGRRSRIWFAQHRVDFRKAHNGLLAEAFKMNLDPFNGDVIIFVGKNRKRIKILSADETGLWVSAKVFTMETMKTKFKFLKDPSSHSITQAELMMLMEGSRYKLERKVAVYEKQLT